ncbi:UNVERIFIED_CONTAM: hypothetical protein K2H54_003071 [Gekko kuhli]
MGNAASSSVEASPAKELKGQPAAAAASSPLPPKQPAAAAAPKQPMPSAGELEERFAHVLSDDPGSLQPHTQRCPFLRDCSLCSVLGNVLVREGS